jgi:hypothetical protein
MSSRRADPEPGEAMTPSRGRRPFEAWRKLALTGAVILLAGSILDAALDDFPRVLNLATLGFGWAFLAAGFGRAMVDRRARERAAERKPE